MEMIDILKEYCDLEYRLACIVVHSKSCDPVEIERLGFLSIQRCLGATQMADMASEGKFFDKLSEVFEDYKNKITEITT